MAAVQLAFNMRTSAGVKTVHLLGSWDGYTGQLPLAKDKSSSKAGSWKGTFRFQGTTLEPGQRYWYYYIIDGYHVSHDPAEPFTVEPTTGRKLNILDVARESSSHSSSSSRSKTSSSSKSSSSKHSSSRDKHSSSRDKHSTSSSHRRESRRDSLNLSLDIPKGRPLSISKIQSPKPISPGAARFLTGSTYEPQTVEELTERFAATAFTDVDYECASPPSSVGSGLSSRSGSSSSGTSSAVSSNSSMSDYSSNSSPVNCSCERYGITRKGDRIKLDCGGSRCGYLDDTGSCCSDDSQERYISSRSRRHGGVQVRR